MPAAARLVLKKAVLRAAAVAVADAADVDAAIATAETVRRVRAMLHWKRVQLPPMARLQQTRSAKASRERMVRAGGADAVDAVVDVAVQIVRRASRVRQRPAASRANRILSIMRMACR
jgi:hypothetical protein